MILLGKSIYIRITSAERFVFALLLIRSYNHLVFIYSTLPIELSFNFVLSLVFSFPLLSTYIDISTLTGSHVTAWAIKGYANVLAFHHFSTHCLHLRSLMGPTHRWRVDIFFHIGSNDRLGRLDFAEGLSYRLRHSWRNPRLCWDGSLKWVLLQEGSHHRWCVRRPTRSSVPQWKWSWCEHIARGCQWD